MRYEELVLRLEQLIEEAGCPERVTTDSIVQLYQRDELRKILNVNNVSYHRHGDRRMNQMKSKTEMAEQLYEIVTQGQFSSLLKTDESEDLLEDTESGGGGGERSTEANRGTKRARGS